MSTLKLIIETQQRIIDKLVECESVIAELYALYGQHIPDMAGFWGKLAAEERYHAILLEKVRVQLDRGELFRNLGDFNLKSTQNLIDFIRQKIAEAQKKVPLASEAASIALKVESSIIDSRFFDMVVSDSPEFREIVEQVSAETRDHVKRVQDEKLRCDDLRRKAGLPLPPATR
ncbi:MAG: hypothetical protein K9M54_05945 [Kiritimatiellales bacterium]|nr:hypothetical protein [Kiritimatiellales bacterium]MCF7864700.1 hypothetical protein [Kiritimatiellales bacterium]